MLQGLELGGRPRRAFLPRRPSQALLQEPSEPRGGLRDLVIRPVSPPPIPLRPFFRLAFAALGSLAFFTLPPRLGIASGPLLLLGALVRLALLALGFQIGRAHV